MPPSSPHEPLRLSADDLYSPRVEAFLDEQAMMSRALPEVEPQPRPVRSSRCSGTGRSRRRRITCSQARMWRSSNGSRRYGCTAG